MSDILKHYYGEAGITELEKVAQAVLEGYTKEASALDKLAGVRAEEMLKVASENIEAGSDESGGFDEAVNLRALEMLDDEGYDVDKVLGALGEGE